jgi:uncharacterized repeat protein (TIGR03803 family)
MHFRRFVSIGFAFAVSACSTFTPQASSGNAGLQATPKTKWASARGTLTTLYSFQGQPDGADPQGRVSVYHSCASNCTTTIIGSTSAGGTNNAGTIYSLFSPLSGAGFTEKIRLSYTPSETGSDPTGPVIQKLYPDPLFATASQGGIHDKGTIIELPSIKGTNAALSFDGRDGAFPAGALIWAYQNTYFAGTLAGGRYHRGAIVSITRMHKKLTAKVLYSFSGKSDGEHPNSLFHLNNSAAPYYGTTAGSKSVPGTVDAFIPGQGLTTLYTFEISKNQGTPTGIIPLLVYSNRPRLLAGTTANGGSLGFGTLYELKAKGSKYTRVLLHTFAGGSADGAYPQGPLIHAGEGYSVYGVTTGGGRGGCGTIFSYDPSSGKYAVVYSFTCDADGAYPKAPLASDGNLLYGTTSGGGTANDGVVFSFHLP